MKVIMAKDSAFILLRLRRNSPVLAVRETTLKGGIFLLRPSRSREINSMALFRWARIPPGPHRPVIQVEWLQVHDLNKFQSFQLF